MSEKEYKTVKDMIMESDAKKKALDNALAAVNTSEIINAPDFQDGIEYAEFVYSGLIPETDSLEEISVFEKENPETGRTVNIFK